MRQTFKIDGIIMRLFIPKNEKTKYKDREDAGEILAEILSKNYKNKNTVVLAIPNGGVVVALPIAKKLNSLFGLIVVRKIHIPWDSEAGFGAVSYDGTVILNEALLPSLGLSEEEINSLAEEELKEIRRRMEFYGAKKLPNLEARTVFLVDDGLASGFTMISAAQTVRKKNPKEIIVSVPTASGSAIKRVEKYVDKIICPDIRTGFIFAVADAYENWYDLKDEDVVKLLTIARDKQ
ncbi:MAG: phosphoribosyltransferase family protein [Candidatus Thermoplasmatota archaeon]